MLTTSFNLGECCRCCRRILCVLGETPVPPKEPEIPANLEPDGPPPSPAGSVTANGEHSALLSHNFVCHERYRYYV